MKLIFEDKERLTAEQRDLLRSEWERAMPDIRLLAIEDCEIVIKRGGS